MGLITKKPTLTRDEPSIGGCCSKERPNSQPTLVRRGSGLVLCCGLLNPGFAIGPVVTPPSGSGNGGTNTCGRLQLYIGDNIATATPITPGSSFTDTHIEGASDLRIDNIIIRNIGGVPASLDAINISSAPTGGVWSYTSTPSVTLPVVLQPGGFISLDVSVDGEEAWVGGEKFSFSAVLNSPGCNASASNFTVDYEVVQCNNPIVFTNLRIANTPTGVSANTPAGISVNSNGNVAMNGGQNTANVTQFNAIAGVATTFNVPIDYLEASSHLLAYQGVFLPARQIGVTIFDNSPRTVTTGDTTATGANLGFALDVYPTTPAGTYEFTYVLAFNLCGVIREFFVPIAVIVA